MKRYICRMILPLFIILWICTFLENTWACGPFYETESELSLLIPGITDESVLSRYYHEGRADGVEADSVNISEWQDFFQKYGEGTSYEEALHDVIYDAGNLEQLKSLLQNPPFEATAANDPIAVFVQGVNREAVEYLIFAKECERLIVVEHDRWQEIDRDKVGMQRLLQEGRRKYRVCHSDFLKLRYAYQLVRLARYLGNYEACVRLYDTLIVNLEVDSTIRYWALDHKAGALRRLGKTAEALYFFSRVFDKAPERRLSASRSFRMTLGSEQQWQECLGYAKDDYEKSVLWMLWSSVHSYGKSLELLDYIYKLNPSSPLLEGLLTKEIQKIEQEHNTSSEYLAELKRFVLDASAFGEIRRPAFWYAMAGYLAFIERRLQEARNYLNTAQELCTDDQPILSHQIALLQHLIPLYSQSRYHNAITPDGEQQFYHDVHWLYDHNHEQIADSLLSLLAQKYLVQNDVYKAICCLLKAMDDVFYLNDYRAKILLDVYATQSDLQKLYDFVVQGEHSSFEHLLVEGFPLSPDELLDLQGTRLLRNRQFQEAYRVFNAISKEYWPSGNIDPDSCNNGKLFKTSFSGNPYHRSGKNWELEVFTKLTFTQKLIELEQKISEDPKNADRYYWQIGNAFYQTPFWSYTQFVWDMENKYDNIFSCWHACDCLTFYRYRSSINLLDPEEPDFIERLQEQGKEILQDCNTRRTALYYYQQALNKTNNEERGAEITVLAHSCVNPVKLWLTSNRGYSKYFRTIRHRSYLHILKDRYTGTTFYNRMIEECATFRYFANQR